MEDDPSLEVQINFNEKFTRIKLITEAPDLEEDSDDNESPLIHNQPDRILDATYPVLENDSFDNKLEENTVDFAYDHMTFSTGEM